jgi:uncharacterized protein (TIGR02186 family)
MIRVSILVGFLLLALAPAQRASGQALVADLTDHFVAITAGFVGTSVTLFGTTESEGDIVVVVRGPKQFEEVRRKSHLAGIWINRRSLRFAGVPGYFATLSSRPVEDLLSPAKRSLGGIGVESLKLLPTEPAEPDEIADFRAAMIGSFERDGLYSTKSGALTFLGKHLFRATLNFPASVPTGTYSVDVHLVRQGQIVVTQTIPLVIEQTGFEAVINDFAVGHRTLYGIVVVLAAAMAGWIGSTLLRGWR